MPDHLIPGEDYYLNEDGYIVLTAAYHLKKGYCCGNGCLHCPFNYDAVPEPKRSELLATLKHEKKQRN
ncbi:MAG TPA: hypothetical protein DCQ34_02330 [Chitinophagaceae bacterium]|nr:hypothetical protein [Chitinophagaceae bacterium]HCY89675.1 hypothetical protein [Chitinophagaceae bacterium]HRF27237.1 DUF5522 domain-containing protein [Ferruginibacter sp.]